MKNIIAAIDQHIVLTSADQVYQICKLFFEEFQFNYFDITFTYPDGSFTSLTSDPSPPTQNAN